MSAVLDKNNYAASRALGLGLEANPEIEGMGIISARDYETEVNTNPVIQTGNKIVLFKEDLKPANEMVSVTSMHVVDEDVSGKKTVNHYEAGSSGLLELSDSEILPSWGTSRLIFVSSQRLRFARSRSAIWKY